MQVMVIAEGVDLYTTPKAQISAVRACIEQLSKDPRVRNIWGFTGQSVGCCVIAEVPNAHEAQRLAAFLQVSGLPNAQVYPLVGGEQFHWGLEETEAAATVTTPTRRQPKGEQT